MLVAGSPPSKTHSQDVGLFVDWSVKATVPPTVIVVGFPTKFATGGVGVAVTVIYAFFTTYPHHLRLLQ